MAIISKYRDQIGDQAVIDEFDQLTAGITGLLRVEHEEDGTHGDINPTSLTLQGGEVGTLTNLIYNASRFQTLDSGVWTVTEANINYFFYSRVGQIITLFFSFSGTTITGGGADDGLYISIPELATLPNKNHRPYISSSIYWSSPEGNEGGPAVFNGLAQAGVFSAPPLTSGNQTASTLIEVSRIRSDATLGAWADSSNLYLEGTVIFPITQNNIPYATYYA